MATLIPRPTASPVPEATFGLTTEFQREIPQMIGADEIALAKKNGVHTAAMEEFLPEFLMESEEFLYYGDLSRIFQVRKETDGFRLTPKAEFGEVIKEAPYDLCTAAMSGETVFISSLSGEYWYPPTTFEEIGSNYTKLIMEHESGPVPESARTEPTKIILEYDNGKSTTVTSGTVQKLLATAKGTVRLRNMRFFAGTRELTRMEIVNYHVPEWLRMIKGEVTYYEK